MCTRVSPRCHVGLAALTWHMADCCGQRRSVTISSHSAALASNAAGAGLQTTPTPRGLVSAGGRELPSSTGRRVPAQRTKSCFPLEGQGPGLDPVLPEHAVQEGTGSGRTPVRGALSPSVK